MGLMNDTLSFYECGLSSGDPKRFWGHSNPTVADLGFSVGGGANPPGRGRQHMILPNFVTNCMKLRKFWAVGDARDGVAPLNPPLLPAAIE